MPEWLRWFPPSHKFSSTDGIAPAIASSVKMSGHFRRVRRYHRGNQNPRIDEEQTIQWPKQKQSKGQTTIHKTSHKKPNTQPRTRVTEWKRISTCFLLFVYVSIADKESIIPEGAPLTGLRSPPSVTSSLLDFQRHRSWWFLLCSMRLDERCGC